MDSQGRGRIPEVKKRDLLHAYQLKVDAKRRDEESAKTHRFSSETSRVKYHQYAKGQTEPQLAGSHMTATAKKLTDEGTYTGVYKQRLNERDGRFIDDLSAQGTGELCASPKRARRLLKSTPVAKLNMPGRSGDYRTEVEWRLQLRPNIDN